MAVIARWPPAWGRGNCAAGPSEGAARTRTTQRSFARRGVVAGALGVPPVGVEPTLGTLLGGRPLPLGYGGWVMIPRPVLSILARGHGGRKIRPGSHMQFMATIRECEALPICLGLAKLRTQRSQSAATGAPRRCVAPAPRTRPRGARGRTPRPASPG